jgi:exoribonuclease R
VPSPGGDPDAFLANISEEVWERNRRPVGHAAWACAKDVIHMHSIAMNRRKSRLTNGAIVLSKFKLTYRLDEKGNPYTVGTYTIRESNQLVEEYMLLANYLVAEELLLKVKGAAFLRNHAPPNTKGMNEVEALANFLQIPMDLSSSKAIQESLARVTQEQTEEITSSAMTSLLMHPMNLAKYMVAQTSTPMGWKHFALAIPYYTHFTSPIRRYADVIVHRLLQEGLTDVSAAANVMESQSFMNYLKDTAEICNDMRVKAKTAQERSDVVFLAAYLMNRGAVYTEAIVIGMGEKSFTLLIPEYSMEARMFIDNMPSVAASYEPQSRTMTLRRSGNRAEHNGGNKEGRGEDKGGRGHDKRNNKNFNDRRNNANALDAHAEFDVLPLTILSKVTVRLSAKETPPVGVFVGLVRSSDGTYPTTSAGSKGHQSAGGGGMRGLEEDLESLKVSAFDGDDQL